MKNTLYVYDHEGWALHNVGSLWAEMCRKNHVLDLVGSEHYSDDLGRNYDQIFWGCTLTRPKPMLGHRYISITFPSRVCRFIANKNMTHISVVHDPCELFSQSEYWHNLHPNIHRLKWFDRIGVISDEMDRILKKYRIPCYKIYTSSTLPIRNDSEIHKEQLKIFMRATSIPRKNWQQFWRLKYYHKDLYIKFEGFEGPSVLPRSEYLNTIDAYNCYICTSWQEGGPLTLMDAVHRGCVILTTRVGQAERYVIDGFNGYFCTSDNEFSKKIIFLSEHKNTLLRMRRNSLKIARRLQTDPIISKQINRFLDGPNTETHER